MMWIIYALLTAVFTSLKSVASKKSLRSLDAFVISWFIFFFSGVFLSLFFLKADIPELSNYFWIILFLDCLPSALAAVMSIKALESDMSASVPMTAFTPLFMLLTGWLMLGEVPDAFGLAGVILIVAGVYILNIRERKNGWRAPFSALVKHEGPRLMLGASLIWSITGILDKIAVQNSSPLFFAMAENILIALFIFPFAYKRIKRQEREIRKEKIHLIAVIILSALVVYCQMIAISQALVVYVIAIKRFSIVIAILLGGVVFKEKDIRLKLVGGIVMVLGVMLITLF